MLILVLVITTVNDSCLLALVTLGHESVCWCVYTYTDLLGSGDSSVTQRLKAESKRIIKLSTHSNGC